MNPSPRPLHRLVTASANMWHGFVVFVSGEWMLRLRSRRPNGGSLILARSLWCTGIIYGLALIVHEALDPDPMKQNSLSWQAFRELLMSSGSWAAAIFAATYATLYTRFSAQWTYLAAVYNQIKAAELRMLERDPMPAARAALAQWKAGFIEDADDLHLATKPLFASVIVAWSEEHDVACAFRDHAVTGCDRLRPLVAAAKFYAKKHGEELPDRPREPAHSPAATSAPNPPSN